MVVITSLTIVIAAVFDLTGDLAGAGEHFHRGPCSAGRHTDPDQREPPRQP